MATMQFDGPTFALVVPTDWFVVSAPEYQTAFLAPPDARGQRASFTIAIRPLPGPVTAQQFAEVITQTYDRLGVTHEVLSRDVLKLGEVEGHAITSLLSQPDGDTPLRQQQVVAVNDDLIYVLVASRPADLPDPAAEAIDRSFATMFGAFTFRQATLPG